MDERKHPRNPKPDAARRQRPTGALIPRFEPRPPSPRAGDRNAARPPQPKSIRRAALLAGQKRGAAVARSRNHRKSRERRPSPNNKTYVACGAVTNEHSGKIPNQNEQRESHVHPADLV